ncbi:MAG: methyltransferase domain-containing protein [Clostridia bacterium]|nr:methyltransferase domain-containing protein [Clostridia bacterium]
MLSKRDKFYLAAERLGGLRCSVCGGKLRRAGDDFSCGKHRVNVHRKGCVNFLSSPVDSCYDAALFDARQRVLGAGCYRPVAEAIERLLPPGSHRILDAGCGDGWYLSELLTRHPDWCGAGVDISRDAIFHATAQEAPAVWCVADLRRLPFADGTFTAVLDVLTPANYGEFTRVLAADGVLVKVYPGEDYLQELRAARGMPRYEAGQVEQYLREKTQVLAHERVHRTISVDAALWRDFVWMTPLNQDLTDAEKQRIADCPAPTVTIDLHVAVCR